MMMEALWHPFPAAVASPLSEIPAVAITAFPSIKRNNRRRLFNLNLSSSSSTLSLSISCTSSTSTPLTSNSTTGNRRRWRVLMDRPPQELASKPEVVNYFVNTLEIVLRSEKDAQMSMYDVSCGDDDAYFGFCCDIDEQESAELARVPWVLSVMPDPDYSSTKMGYDSSTSLNNSSNPLETSVWWLFPPGTAKYWLVRMSNPGTGVNTTKAHVVDYCTPILTKVLKNERDAQMCMYHVSWQSDLEICCVLDEDCANELAGLPAVLSVQPDKDFHSKIADPRGFPVDTADDSGERSKSSDAIPAGTKKLFVSGLSFYTSEKTLREAFGEFGELVEVKIIIDKISKRSKGYAFIEYATEAAASAALKEMNGKIINGWMIVVDVAKSPTPKSQTPKYSGRGNNSNRSW